MPCTTLNVYRISTVPVWEKDGEFVYGLQAWEAFGFDEEPEPVGWANIATVEIDGTAYELLRVRQEDED